MPSEKMRYIRRHLDDKPRTDIEPTLLKAEIEAVFHKRNIDGDCDTIARLLEPYRKAVTITSTTCIRPIMCARI